MSGPTETRLKPRAAEFFAGIGLVRLAMESAGFDVVWANDIEPVKRDLYAANFRDDDFRLGDVRDVRGEEVPDIEIATASFPCVDLSLAGNRRGLAGEQSGMFWEFARILGEMGPRRPPMVLLENVPSFATSHGGGDLRAALQRLNDLGYSCDLFVIDARRFVPQSRQRLFIVGMTEPDPSWVDFSPSELRPHWIGGLLQGFPVLRLHARPLALGLRPAASLASVVERLSPDDPAWWDEQRLARFQDSLAPLHRSRLELLAESPAPTWATAYRRTRKGRATWEIRADSISGCLRTARGGSSKQALVEAASGAFRVRWMTAREYARLQGVEDSYRIDHVSTNQALFGFGDAVCVPVVAWIASEYLHGTLDSTRAGSMKATAACG